MFLQGNLIDKKTVVQLDSNVQKTIDFTAQFDGDLPPQKDPLTLTIKEGGNVLYQSAISLEIAPYTTAFTKKVFTTENYLKYVEEISLLNEQNVKATQRILRPAPFWKGLLTGSDPDATIESGENGRQYVWEVTLNPKETKNLTITTNYRIPLYLLFLFLFGAFLFFMFRDPILINKRAELIKLHDGGITEFRIIVAIKNRRKKEFNHVQIGRAHV